MLRGEIGKPHFGSAACLIAYEDEIHCDTFVTMKVLDVRHATMETYSGTWIGVSPLVPKHNQYGEIIGYFEYFEDSNVLREEEWVQLHQIIDIDQQNLFLKEKGVHGWYIADYVKYTTKIYYPKPNQCQQWSYHHIKAINLIIFQKDIFEHDIGASNDILNVETGLGQASINNLNENNPLYSIWWKSPPKVSSFN